MQINVAIVDDDRNVLEALRRGIEIGPRFSCNGCFSSAADALEVIPAGRFDVVLMDICMPVISGIECTRKLRTILPGLSVIMMTGWNEPSLMFDALAAGASGFLTKPLRASECRLAIDEVLEGRAPLCGEAATFLLKFFQQATSPVDGLPEVSEREREIIACLVQGQSDREIAAQLGIGVATVRTHMHRMFGKLGVSNRQAVVGKYAGLPPRTPIGWEVRA